MRMPTDQLRAYRVEHIGDGERTTLCSQLRMEHYLKEQITEFLTHPWIRFALDGIDRFVGFLDQIRDESTVGLFPVPGAPGRAAQLSHDLTEISEGTTVCRRHDDHPCG